MLAADASSAAGPSVPAPDELRARGGKKWTTHPADVLPMWLADMDFTAPEPVRAVVAEAAAAGAFEYPAEALYAAVGDAFLDRMVGRFGWEPDPEGTELLADLVQGLVTTVVALTDPGHTVITLTPVYPPFLTAAGVAGRRLVPVELRREHGFRVDPGALAAAFERSGARVLLLCNPHNPTGRALSADELLAIAEVAHRYDAVVVSDEIHADLVLPAAAPARVAHIPFGSVADDAAARTVTLQSATKAFNLGGMRCGVAHFGSDALHRRFAARFPARSLGRVTSLSARATATAWRECDPWLAAVTRQLAENRDILARWVARLPERVRWLPPEATYLAWLQLPGLSEASAAGVLLERGRVAVSAGEDFGGPHLRDHVRLNFATSPDLLATGLSRIGAALENPSGGDRPPPARLPVSAVGPINEGERT